jgi:hypothetical protein
MDTLLLPQGYLHILTPCHNLVAKDLATWTYPGIYLAHYTDIILVTSYSLAELEVAAVSLQLV